MQLASDGVNKLLIYIPADELAIVGLTPEDFKAKPQKVRDYVMPILYEQPLIKIDRSTPIEIGVGVRPDCVVIEVTKTVSQHTSIKTSSFKEVRRNTSTPTTTQKPPYVTLRFATFDDLLLATNRVANNYSKQVLKNSKLYVLDKTYYLSLLMVYPSGRPRKNIENILAILEEHSTHSDRTEAYLSRRGKLLIPEGAIVQMGSLA